MTAPAIPDQMDSQVDDMTWIWQPLLAALALQLFSWEYLLVLAAVRQADSPKAALAVILALYARQGLIRRTWARRMEPLLTDIYRRAGANLPEQPSPSQLARAVQARSEQVAADVTRRTAADVKDALSGTVTDLEGAVRPVYAELVLTMRSSRIAQVESTFAASEGEFMAASASGYDLIMWLHSGHPRHPRDWHVAIDGVQIPVGDIFPTTTVRFPRDARGDPEDTINCTCSARYLTAG